MARKPNYRFERAERERLKDQKRAKKEQRRASREEPEADATSQPSQDVPSNGSS
jgi:hypothetical protein